uniref:Putative secreted protein n=1 Tax=Rhipicephalus microplus TaxID=6941 RepID=A0A6M2DAK9_RHIMP
MFCFFFFFFCLYCAFIQIQCHDRRPRKKTMHLIHIQVDALICTQVDQYNAKWQDYFCNTITQTNMTFGHNFLHIGVVCSLNHTFFFFKITQFNGKSALPLLESQSGQNKIAHRASCHLH